MSTTLSRLAYAKVNLHLAVGAPFSDGYHPIESIFSLIDLSDQIQMSWSESDTFSIEVTGLEAYCKKGEDTLSKAALLWYEKSCLPLSVRVHCEKHIPVKAGLGGGSSDAAALLLLLQEAAFDKALSFSLLEEIALQVGSDVPFFLSGFSCALVQGRGELISELFVEPKAIVVVQPKDYSVSTKEAFALFDRLLEKNQLSQRVSLKKVVAHLEKKSSEWNDLFFNDFEQCTNFSDFYEVVADIASSYPGFGSLSGSGSCWYFISENSKSVVELSKELHNKFLDRVQLWCTTLI